MTALHGVNPAVFGRVTMLEWLGTLETEGLLQIGSVLTSEAAGPRRAPKAKGVRGPKRLRTSRD